MTTTMNICDACKKEFPENETTTYMIDGDDACLCHACDMAPAGHQAQGSKGKDEESQ